MAGKAILVIGNSGSGKSTSMRNLNPEETFVFSVLGKGLPFKGSKKNYTLWNKDTNPKGNMLVTSSSKVISNWLRGISEKMPHIKTVVVDDATFLAAKELDRRREEMGYNKFSDIAHDFLHITETANLLRDDLNIYFLYHTKDTGDGILEDKNTRAMSHGKMIDEKLASIEAQFEIVLLADKIIGDDEQVRHVFKTKDLNSTVKTPIDMFSEQYIDNDLSTINDAIKCYYEGEGC